MASGQQEVERAERAEAAARLAADDLKDINKGDMTYKVTEKTTTTEPERPSGTTTLSDDEARTELRGDEGTGKTTVTVDVKDTRDGHVATSHKASDQMTGQTFNDVGGMDVEAVKWKI